MQLVSVPVLWMTGDTHKRIFIADSDSTFYCIFTEAVFLQYCIELVIGFHITDSDFNFGTKMMLRLRPLLYVLPCFLELNSYLLIWHEKPVHAMAAAFAHMIQKQQRSGVWSYLTAIHMSFCVHS